MLNNRLIIPLTALAFLAVSSPVRPSEAEQSTIKLISTLQDYSHYRPWKKGKPYRRSSTAVYIGQNLFLTAADIIANHTFLEVQKKSRAEKFPAELVHVDYSTNLALVRSKRSSFLTGLRPARISKTFIGQKSEVRISKLNSSRQLIEAPGTVFDVSEYNYPYTDDALLAYKAYANIEGGGWSEAVYHRERHELVGLTMYYDQKKNTAVIIPSPFIRSFLLMYKTGKRGLPMAGLTYYPLTNPDLREYLGVPTLRAGVLISGVLHGTSAYGYLKNGDILLSVEGIPVDFEGTYKHPLLGDVSLESLFIFGQGGKPLLPKDRVDCIVLRDGNRVKVSFRLRHFSWKQARINQSMPDIAPNYYILGGYIFTELSLPYLKEWGSRWRKNASRRLIFYNDYLTYYDPTDNSMDLQAIQSIARRKRIIILSHVLADDSTVGMEWIRDRILLDAGGQPIENIADLHRYIENHKGDFVKLRLSGNIPVVVRTKDLPSIKRRIRSVHRIDKLMHIRPNENQSTAGR